MVHYFFTEYINDFVVDIVSSIRLFADDTSLYIIVDDPETAAGCLNTDLQRITRWAAIWFIQPYKDGSLSRISKTKLKSSSDLHAKPTNNRVEAHKHLGTHFSNDCTWHHHVKYITDKAWTRINIMRKLKVKLDRNSLE